jgi:uncharacterized protein YrzB (UPF0473 family)
MSEHQHDDQCGCGEDHEHEEAVFVVTDEDGTEHEMVVVYTFESKEQLYAVLLDRNDPEADGMIVRVMERDEEAYLEPIEDDEEWERVSAIYEKLAEEANSEG